MRTWIKRTLVIIIVLLGIGLIYGYFAFRPTGLVATGYTAKWICSSHFNSGVDPTVAQSELPDNPLVPILRTTVDTDAGVVKASLLGLYQQHAAYTDGLGCTLMTSGEDRLPENASAGEPIAVNPDALWPTGAKVDLSQVPNGVDQAAVQAAVNAALAEPFGDNSRRTRAAIVVYDGQIVAEGYGPGFDENSPLLGWSMTKSVTNALLGTLVRDGKLALEKSPPVPEWAGPDDPRNAITLDQLLRMSSGLEFAEEYSNLTSDVTQMLYVQESMGGFSAEKPLVTSPDGIWNYNSGTTNILQRVIRTVLGSDEAYWRYPREALFEPLGMATAIIEPDAAGDFVGSSYGYASGRDWARIGLLYLQDGVWQGERILPEGWVAYSTTQTPLSDGEYGAHFWLNQDAPGQPGSREWPDLPEDLYYMSGHDGQTVAVIPSRNVVIVRLGLTYDSDAWAVEEFIGDVLDALPNP